MSTRSELHEMVDALPEKMTGAVRLFLEFVITKKDNDVFSAFIRAPEDDEPLVAGDWEEVEAARADIRAGRVKAFVPTHSGIKCSSS